VREQAAKQRMALAQNERSVTVASSLLFSVGACGLGLWGGFDHLGGFGWGSPCKLRYGTTVVTQRHRDREITGTLQ